MITFHQYFHHLQVLEVAEDMAAEEAAEQLEEVALAETMELVNMVE
jgi:CheY-specific phosphatase CheX